jgi:hypothetical protein
MLSLRSLTAALVALALPAVLVPQQADALHVAIICSFGTRSDIAPIFEGLRDFALEDGNKVSYVAAPGLATTHAGQFPYVETQLISNVILPAYFNNSAISDVMQTKKKYDNTRVFLDAIGFIADIYEHNTRAYIDYFEQGHKFDLVLCDAVEQACMDAAKHTGQKLAIYGPLGQYGVGAEWYVPDFLDPMPMEQWIASPWQRAKGFIDLIPFAIETIKASWKVQAAQQRLQLNVPYMDPWEFPQKHLMLAHHVLGIDPARNVPTNIQVFGPVVNEETIPPIEPELQRALDGFQAQGTRAVFIAFGSVLTLEDSPELYAIMLDSIATLLADPHRNLAVIWASAYHDTARTEPIQKRFPGRFLTPKWANQRRALMHDAVQLAINHAGYGSITEALYNGKAQIMLPFVFDEFVNTANAEEAGISLSLDKYTMTSEEMTTKVTLLLDQAADPTSVYAQNLHKWKTICRLNSEKAKAIVTNAVKLAASVGVDHLVPRDVTLSLFDRFDIGSVVLALLVVSTLRKLLASHHKPSPQTATISAKPKRL